MAAIVQWHRETLGMTSLYHIPHQMTATPLNDPAKSVFQVFFCFIIVFVDSYTRRRYAGRGFAQPGLRIVVVAGAESAPYMAHGQGKAGVGGEEIPLLQGFEK